MRKAKPLSYRQVKRLYRTGRLPKGCPRHFTVKPLSNRQIDNLIYSAKRLDVYENAQGRETLYTYDMLFTDRNEFRAIISLDFVDGAVRGFLTTG